jgi:bifunctional DNA-binding transcriptional regulator/antitoxin component of YhaV-PrlF toxin-antitoxin module
MANPSTRSTYIERKIISVSNKRQVTIPKKYFEALGFSSEAECILQKNSIIIHPICVNTGSEFSEQILADLISQGFSGQELLNKFKELSNKVTPAMKRLISEADSIATGEKRSAAMSDIFGAED